LYISPLKAIVSRNHRLMAGRTQVDDGKPAETKGDAGAGIGPGTGIVRTAQAQPFGHGVDDRAQRLCLRTRRAKQKTGKAAHEAVVSVSFAVPQRQLRPIRRQRRRARPRPGAFSGT